MPNSFYNATELASVALALVGPDLKAAQTVSRSYESAFDGKIGYSVNVRRPGALKGRTRTVSAVAAITSDSIAESVSAITLTDEIYSAVDVTDAEMTLKIEDFGRQVLKPQTDAIVYDVDALVVAKMAAVTPTIDLPATVDFASLKSAALTARKTFRDNSVPAEGLFCAMGTESYAAWLDGLTYAVTGSADVLKSGEGLPSLMGFSVIEDNRLEADRVVFYHRDAWHLAVRAPIVPRGVTNGASVSANGFAIRSIFDYDASTLQDRSVLSTFVGVNDLGLVKRAENGTTSVYVPALAADKSVS